MLSACGEPSGKGAGICGLGCGRRAGEASDEPGRRLEELCWWEDCRDDSGRGAEACGAGVLDAEVG